MEPIGQAFNAFDSIGAFASSDPDRDLSGEIAATSKSVEVAGPFRTPAELAQRLAGSDVVSDCVAEHWAQYASRREMTEADRCALREIQERFRTSGSNVRELLVAIAAPKQAPVRGCELLESRSRA